MSAGTTTTQESNVPHLFHRWSRWQDVEATRQSPLFPKLGTWRAPMQVRRCETCGKKQTRDI